MDQRNDDPSGKDLISKFKDPSSAYYTHPRTAGPSSPADHSSSRRLSNMALPADSSPSESDTQRHQEKSRESGFKWFASNGYDLKGVLEWPVAWGDCDMFQHVNNVQYARWTESARIKYAESFVDELPKGVMKDMLAGRGIGIILKDLMIKYRMPVTYPDTVIIANRPHSIQQDRATYKVENSIWSLKMNQVVATAESTMVCYDYDNLRKGTMSDEMRSSLERRIKA